MNNRLSDSQKVDMYRLYIQGKRPSEISRYAGVKPSTVYAYLKAFRAGKSSPSEYMKQLAQRKGYKTKFKYELSLLTSRNMTYVQYRNYLAVQKGYNSRKELLDEKAQEKGFESNSEMNEANAKERKKRKANKKLADILFITSKMKKIRQIDIVNQLGYSKRAVHNYFTGRQIPSPKRLAKIFEFLGLKYSTIDDLLCD